MHKPLVGITMGDPSGVGPEVIVGAWTSPAVHAVCRPVVLGHPAVLARAAKLLQNGVEVFALESCASAEPAPSRLPCLAVTAPDADEAPPALLDRRGGQAAYDALVVAARLALDRQIDAIVTAPLNKAALWLAGHHYPGHTELLAELCGVDDFAMMLYLAHGEGIRGPAGLGVVHVTLHMGIADVPRHITRDEVIRKIRLADASLRRLGAERPRVGVVALNPHAGEEGLFGREEIDIIAPAVALCREEGILCTGPLPADSLMVRARDGEFDAVVAMYHDQGHIALKLLGMHRAVNITLGLPIVRTSVAHGTAFDLAWQGKAETSSMVEAIRVASLLSRER
ncbi:MAG: 4-hydroxythreonine-4-phosphate dehydrogenase PdxA [Planctomycetaceae bacterium]|nr:4-hydroxythreonine-4-phosphate dehydrogenase PdxA [Planctomycetaceae bacterium]